MAMRRPRLLAASLTCMLSGWISLSGQSLTPTVMSPAQVAISEPLSRGRDTGKENAKAKIHRRLPDRGGAASQSDGGLQTTLGPFINATAGTHFDGVGASGSAPSDVNMAVGQNPAYNYILQ